MPIFKPSISQFPTPTITTDEYAIPLLHPDKWLEEAAEGELAVDVIETPTQFVVQSTLAGVRPQDLALSLHRDLLTMRGERASSCSRADAKYLTQECYWGKFSRSILLPEPVDTARATATLKQGVLTVTLPKLVERTEIPVEDGE
jgi:HSP20 family protein